jgi:hypothetical protein
MVETTATSLIILLHDFGRSDLGLVRILPDGAKCSPLAEKIPALVEFYLNGVEARAFVLRQRFLCLKPMFLCHQFLDVS